MASRGSTSLTTILSPSMRFAYSGSGARLGERRDRPELFDLVEAVRDSLGVRQSSAAGLFRIGGGSDLACRASLGAESFTLILSNGKCRAIAEP